MGYSQILKFNLVLALFILLSVAVNADDIIVEIGNIYAEKGNELFLSLKNTEANGHDYRLVSAGSLGGIGAGKFAVYDATAGSARLTIDSDGDVGIGTTGPGAKLDILNTNAGQAGFYLKAAPSQSADLFQIRDANGNYIFRVRDQSETDAKILVVDTLFIGNAFGPRDSRFTKFDSSSVKLDRWDGSNANLYITGNVGIGTTSPSSTYSGLDISSGGLTLVLGAENLASTRTDATQKNSRIANYHYTNAEEPAMLLMGASSSTDNSIYIGGGSSATNAATLITFYTGATTTTTTGTERMRIDSGGNVGIGTTPATGNKLDVSGKIHATGDICTDLSGGKCLSTVSGTGSVAWSSVTGKPAGFADDVDNVGLTSESDPQVGTLTANKWCKAKADGTAINCDQDTPAGDSDWTISGTDMYSGVTGKVGIGAAIPKAKLDVAGEVKVGNTGLTCNSDAAGAIRYTGALEYCDGTSWQAITPGGGAPPGGSCPEQTVTYSISLGPTSATAQCQPNLKNTWDWYYVGEQYSSCTNAGWGNGVNAYSDGSKASYVACPWADTLPAGSTITSIVIDPVNAGNYQSNGLADWYLNNLLLLNNDDLGTTNYNCNDAEDQPNPITLTDADSLSNYNMGGQNKIYIYKQSGQYYILNGGTSTIDVKVSYIPSTC